jgi:hypothetical protein
MNSAAALEGDDHIANHGRPWVQIPPTPAAGRRPLPTRQGVAQDGPRPSRELMPVATRLERPSPSLACADVPQASVHYGHLPSTTVGTGSRRAVPCADGAHPGRLLSSR